MNLKFLVIAVVLLSVLFAFPSSNASSQSLGPGKMTYVIANVGGPSTFDPAMAYDTASGELIQNVYDPLVFLNGTGSDVVPWLASSYRISPDGQTYTFAIKSGVQWQNASYGFVTPADVEYSFERVMVRDYTGGPAWLLWYPIFGQFSANLTDPVDQGTAIDDAITSNATHVVIHFQTGRAYSSFLSILANTWGSILSKQWCIDHGDWNPAVDRLSDGTWANAHDPTTSPLDVPYNIMMGSGPFKLNYVQRGGHYYEITAWSIVRNTNFWGGWSTSRLTNLGFHAGTVTRGYVDEIIEYFISDYATRLAGFTGPTPIYDTIDVPRQNMSSVWQQPGIKCQYPLTELTIDTMFFGYDVGLTSLYIGTPTGYGYFGELGITPDFFSDIHVRKAIAYSFNWTQYISSFYMGEAKQNAIPVPETFKFFNGSLPKCEMNTTRAVEEWKLAWGGQVWANGFTFDICLSSSLPSYQVAAAEIIEANVEAQNPKFHIGVTTEPPPTWDSPPGYALKPLFFGGWLVDYPDVHDFVEPIIASWGYYGSLQCIGNDPFSIEMDNLIKWGANNASDTGRNANYQRLWQLYVQQIPSIPLPEPCGRRWARDWVHGWYHNPIFPGMYGYSLWKEDIQATYGTFAGTHANWEDINEDGRVDIRDLAVAAKAFGAYYIQPLLPPNPFGAPGYYTPNWNSKADVNIVDQSTGARGDMKVDIKDLAQMAKLYGFIASSWMPGP